MSWDDNITIILDRHEAVALSAAILTLGESGHRGEQIEAVRRKLRAGLNHRARDQDEHDAEAAIIAHEYASTLVSPEDYAYSHCEGCGQEFQACECAIGSTGWRVMRHLT